MGRGEEGANNIGEGGGQRWKARGRGGGGGGRGGSWWQKNKSRAAERNGGIKGFALYNRETVWPR